MVGHYKECLRLPLQKSLHVTMIAIKPGTPHLKSAKPHIMEVFLAMKAQDVSLGVCREKQLNCCTLQAHLVVLRSTAAKLVLPTHIPVRDRTCFACGKPGCDSEDGNNAGPSLQHIPRPLWSQQACLLWHTPLGFKTLRPNRDDLTP